MNNDSIVSKIGEGHSKIEDNVPVSLSNQLISLLSEQLYQSPLKAIEELVTNSYDAGANTCKVIIPEGTINLTNDRILVYDDGHGMDIDGLTTLWAIGGSNKRNQGQKIGNRKIIGKFGIGKLATYAIANMISYVTRKENTIYLINLNYSDFKDDPTGGSEKLELPIKQINDFQKLKDDNHFKELTDSVFVDINELLGERKKSWTFVVLESLKNKVSKLKLGRLKWVLSTAMPINPDFELSLNRKNIKSSKLNFDLAFEFAVSELPNKRIESLNKLKPDNWQIKNNLLISDTFKNGISGEIKVTQKTLLGGKSSGIGRSHGFFIKVRERIINPDDETFGSVPTKMGTFNRLNAVINADDLDQVITASRESLENSEMKDLFQNLLNEILNEATGRYTQYIKDKQIEQIRKKEGERNFVNHELMEFPIADTLSFTPNSIPKGGEPDDSFFYVDFGNEEDRDELIKAFYSERKEKFIFKYLINGRSDRLVKFEAKSRTFYINKNHPFIKANIDDNTSANLLEDFVVAETMLEIYLIESGISNHLVGEILEKRDRLLIGLANDHPISLKFIADALRDSYNNDFELEVNHVIAARALGFTAKHIAGPGTPDGLATFNSYDNGLITITLESKSSIKTPALPQLDFAGLQEHMKEYNATGCMLLAPSYPGNSKENSSAVSNRARELKISCWTIEQLAKVLEESEKRKIVTKDIIKIVQNSFTPMDVKEAVGKLLDNKEWNFYELYIAIIKTLETLEDRLSGSLRTLDNIASAITYEVPDMKSITKDEVDEAIKDISHISKGALIYRDNNIHLNTSLVELRKRISSHTGENKGSRKNGNFK